MFICQNVGNLKGFLLVYLHGLYLITLSSYSSTGEAPHHSNINKIKYLSIQLLIRGTCRGATESLTVHSELPYVTGSEKRYIVAHIFKIELLASRGRVSSQL